MNHRLSFAFSAFLGLATVGLPLAGCAADTAGAEPEPSSSSAQADSCVPVLVGAPECGIQATCGDDLEVHCPGEFTGGPTNPTYLYRINADGSRTLVWNVEYLPYAVDAWPHVSTAGYYQVCERRPSSCGEDCDAVSFYAPIAKCATSGGSGGSSGGVHGCVGRCQQ